MLEADPHRNRVLVVDDELAARRGLARILEKQGPYKCAVAASTEEARGLLEQGTFGLVVTDSRMWGEEGIELVREIGDRYPDTVTIMVSGQDDPRLEQQALQSGALFFIRKPFKPEELLSKVGEALDRRDEAMKVRKHRQW